MAKVYNVLDIAKYVINYCNDIGNPISNLQLQKILYYIQVYSFRRRNCRIFKENIEAWRYGPVVPDVYDKYKYFLNKVIDSTGYMDYSEKFEKDDRELINEVIGDKINKSIWDLVDDTHKERPWKDTFKDNYRNVIDIDLIERYASELQ